MPSDVKKRCPPWEIFCGRPPGPCVTLHDRDQFFRSAGRTYLWLLLHSPQQQQQEEVFFNLKPLFSGFGVTQRSVGSIGRRRPRIKKGLGKTSAAETGLESGNEVSRCFVRETESHRNETVKEHIINKQAL